MGQRLIVPVIILLLNFSAILRHWCNFPYHKVFFLEILHTTKVTMAALLYVGSLLFRLCILRLSIAVVSVFDGLFCTRWRSQFLQLYYAINCWPHFSCTKFTELPNFGAMEINLIISLILMEHITQWIYFSMFIRFECFFSVFAIDKTLPETICLQVPCCIIDFLSDLFRVVDLVLSEDVRTEKYSRFFLFD